MFTPNPQTHNANAFGTTAMGALLLLGSITGTLATAAAQPFRPSQGPPIKAGVTPKELKDVRVDEHLNRQLPTTLGFRDEQGRSIQLSSLLDGKRPVVLNFVYHSCPMLCSMVLDATVKALRDVEWTLGKDYIGIAVSIDPKDTPEKARNKRDEMVKAYGRADAKQGWHFLVGEQDAIDKLTRAAGFFYKYDQAQEQYAHPAALLILKPNGSIARYLYGIDFHASDIKLGLLEASQGRSVNTLERILLFCYHYDPKGGKYVLVARRVMQVGGALTACVLGAVLVAFWLREGMRSVA